MAAFQIDENDGTPQIEVINKNDDAFIDIYEHRKIAKDRSSNITANSYG